MTRHCGQLDLLSIIKVDTGKVPVFGHQDSRLVGSGFKLLEKRQSTNPSVGVDLMSTIEPLTLLWILAGETPEVVLHEVYKKLSLPVANLSRQDGVADSFALPIVSLQKRDLSKLDQDRTDLLADFVQRRHGFRRGLETLFS